VWRVFASATLWLCVVQSVVYCLSLVASQGLNWLPENSIESAMNSDLPMAEARNSYVPRNLEPLITEDSLNRWVPSGASEKLQTSLHTQVPDFTKRPEFATSEVAFSASDSALAGVSAQPRETCSAPESEKSDEKTKASVGGSRPESAGDAAREMLKSKLGLGDGLRLTVGDGVVLHVGEGLVVTVGDGLCDGVGLGVLLRVGDGLRLFIGLGLLLSVGDGLCVTVRVRVGPGWHPYGSRPYDASTHPPCAQSSHHSPSGMKKSLWFGGFTRSLK
jgi:hypothetical protein